MGMSMLVALDYETPAPYKKWIAITASILFAFITAYSRVILGVHSIDQVVYGLSIGAWIACTLNYCFKDQIIAHLG